MLVSVEINHLIMRGLMIVINVILVALDIAHNGNYNLLLVLLQLKQAR